MIHGDPHPRADLIVRWGVSLVTGLGLAAVALAGCWLYAHVVRPTGWARVSDDQLTLSLTLAAVAWLVALARIWVGVAADRRARGVIRAACWTLVVALTAIVGGVCIDFSVRRDEEVLITAWVLGLAAAAVALWIPVVRGFRVGRPVMNAEHLVDVRCPGCGYSLIGLRELRCPECGRQFTIDELIRAQNYDGVQRIAFRAGALPRATPQNSASDAAG